MPRKGETRAWARRLLALLVLASALAGCSDPAKDFEEARRKGSVEGYQAFLAKHPEAVQAADAERALAALDWSAARAKATPEAYRQFLSRHASATEAGEAKGLLEDGEWREASAEGVAPERRKALLKAFVDSYPRSAHLDEARDVLWELEVPKVEVSRAVMLFVWSKGKASIYDATTKLMGTYMTTTGQTFDQIGTMAMSSGPGGADPRPEAVVHIWRDFGPRELPKVQALGLRTGVAYARTSSGFAVIRRVDLRKSDKQFRAEFGL